MTRHSPDGGVPPPVSGTGHRRRFRSTDLYGVVGVAAIGGALLVDGNGWFAQECRHVQIVTSVAECSPFGVDCSAQFAAGAAAVALSRRSIGYTPIPLRQTANGYVDFRGRPFPGDAVCRSWFGRGGSVSGWSRGSTASADRTQTTTQRGGFGTTARSFSMSSSGT